MSKKQYTVTTIEHAAQPRSTRRQGVSGSAGGGSVVVGGQSEGNATGSAELAAQAHSHANKPLLDSLSDADGYLLMRQKAANADDSEAGKVKAGYSDEAGVADEARGLSEDSELWDKFLRKDEEDTAHKRIHFARGLVLGDFEAGEQGGFFDGIGNAELLTLVVRQLLRSARFVDGFGGEGWQLWIDQNELANLTIDKLTVRQVMTVFELLIEKIRSVGGQIVVSAANGKIKTVEETEDFYIITFEQDNTFQAHDLMRCQTFTGGNLKSYWVEVAAVDGNSILIAKSEFDASLPAAADECVMMGNTVNTLRQNVILISATEDGQPRIDVMDGVRAKNFSGCLRVRLGRLDGITDSFFGEHQPQGYGLYSDNAYLKGNFILANGEDIGVKFNILQDHISSVVEGGIKLLANGDFTQGTAGWDGYIVDENQDDVPMAYLGSVGKAGAGNDSPFVYVGNSLFTAAMPPYRIEDKEGRLAMWVDLVQLSYSKEYMINTDTLNANSDITLSFWVYVEEQTSFTVAIGTISQTVQLSGDDNVYKWVQFKYSGKWGTNHALVFNDISDVWLSGVQLNVPSTSLIRQSASEIELKLNNTGINIKDGTITLDADKTTVTGDLTVGSLETIPTNGKARIEAKGSLMKVFGIGENTHHNIEFGVDSNGYAVLKYYDNNGNMLYDLGPSGIRRAISDRGTMVASDYVAISDWQDYDDLPSTTTTIYMYAPVLDAENQPIWDDYNTLNSTDMQNWSARASACMNKWFSTNDKTTALADSGGSYTNILDDVAYLASEVGEIWRNFDYSSLISGNPNEEGQQDWINSINEYLEKTYPDPSTPPQFISLSYEAEPISGTGSERWQLKYDIHVRDIIRISNGIMTYTRVWCQLNESLINNRKYRIIAQQNI